MKELILIEAPSNLGLREPQPGVEPGVKFFPSVMEKEGFASMVGIEKKISVPAPAYSMDVDIESNVRNASKIIDYSRELATVLDDCISENLIPVVIGGDCSILIGVALSLKRNGKYGLFYIDGHTDYVLPEQSGSSGAAGMDLAIIAGKGHDKLTNMEDRKPYIQEENIFCFGNRDISEEWYVKEIVESNIHYYDLTSLRANTIQFITGKFLELVEIKKLDGFWIHFDVDVLNDDLMPCVDSRQMDGLSYKELSETLRPLLGSEKFQGINITIFDPTLDKDGFYGRQFAKELAGIIKKGRAI
jgi:arginase